MRVEPRPRTEKQEACQATMREVIKNGRIVRLECPECGWVIDVPPPKQQKRKN